MVGQRFITLLHDHPWYNIKVLAASPRSAGKAYKDAVGAKWCMDEEIPASVADMVVMNATDDVEKIAKEVDFVFCAVDMKKDEIKALEERYAKAECPVVSNNSAHRHTPDVPMIIPEINPQHLEIIPAQKERLGTKRGFIAVKSNCSLQSYLPAMAVINMKYPIDHALVTTYQAISGAGKTFETWPEMVDNLIPYIGGEEMKSEVEPNKVLGKIEGKEIVPSNELSIECQTYRVPVSNGHTAAIFFSFKDGVNKPSVEEIEKMWQTTLVNHRSLTFLTHQSSSSMFILKRTSLTSHRLRLLVKLMVVWLFLVVVLENLTSTITRWFYEPQYSPWCSRWCCSSC